MPRPRAPVPPPCPAPSTLRGKLVAAGFNSGTGMLIDTSRNGWGGSARPTGPGPLTSVDDYVNGDRIDRRVHVGNSPTGALPDAPPAGHWFSAQFQQLMRNAYPPLS